MRFGDAGWREYSDSGGADNRSAEPGRPHNGSEAEMIRRKFSRREYANMSKGGACGVIALMARFNPEKCAVLQLGVYVR